MPAGSAKRARARRKPADACPPRLGARARKEGIGDRCQAHREDQEAGEDRLRNEELGDALDVPQDLAPLRDHRRDGRELASDEDDVGDGAGHLRPAALSDRQLRRLEGRHVVDPVTDHRHVAARIPERLDDPSLPIRSDATENRRLQGQAPQVRILLRQERGVDRRALDPGVAGDGGDGLGPVAGKHLQLDALASEPGDGLARFRTQILAQQEQPARNRMGLVERAGGDPEGQDAPALRGAAGRVLLELAEGEVLGGAEHVPDAADPLGAEPSLRGERDLVFERASARRKGLGNRLERRVARRGRGSVDAELGRKRLGADELGHPQARLGQGAGLVEADDIHRGQGLGRVQLLRKRTEPGHPERADGVRQAREQDQPLRDQRHDSGDGGGNRLAEPRVPMPEGVAEDDAERHQHSYEDEEQPVQRPFERRSRMTEGPRLPGDLLGVAVGADRRDQVLSGPLDDEGARAHGVTGGAAHRSRLSAEDRLVELQPLGAGEGAVGHDVVARPDADEIADDDVVDRHPSRLAVSHHGGIRRDERAQPVDCPFGSHFLPRPDDRVRDQDAEEQCVLPLPEGERRRAGYGENEVEHREDVGTDDARVGTARRTAHLADASRPSPRCLRLRQPPGRS